MTVNVSSSGVVFEAGGNIPAGTAVELSISWPFLLKGVVPLQLWVLGEAVRSEAGVVGVRMRHHEFRTARPGSAWRLGNG